MHGTPPPLYIKHFSTDLRKSQEGSEQKWGGPDPLIPPRGDATVCNAVVKDGKVPEDWSRSWMVNVYKGKGDALTCGSYRDIKLLEHAMKVLESD